MGRKPDTRPQGPTLSEAEWEEKAYTVIGSIRKRTDMTVEYLEQVVDIKLLPDPNSNINHGMSGKTNIGGGYSFSINPVSGSMQADIRMGVGRLDTPENGYSPTCTFDFARVERRLEQMGFEGRESSTGVPYQANWRFVNQERVVSAQFYMVKAPGESEGQKERLCLESFSLLFIYPKEGK